MFEFWLSAITTGLTHIAVFNLLERLVIVYSGNTYLQLANTTVSNSIRIYRLLNTASSMVAAIAVFGFTTGLVSSETFFHYQSWVVGHLMYRGAIGTLYPEIDVSTQDCILNGLMIAASWVYSFGSYSFIYSWALLLSLYEAFEFLKVITAPKSQDKEGRIVLPDFVRDTGVVVSRARTGLLLGLTTSSLFSLNLFPLLFFTVLSGIYSGLIAI